jgi:hypothetical protein
MKLEELEGKSIAIIVQNVDQDDDVHVYLGSLQLQNGEPYFRNNEKDWHVSLDNDKLDRLKPVVEELKTTLLNADYYLHMTIQSLPDTSVEDLVKTNMKWHD